MKVCWLTIVSFMVLNLMEKARELVVVDEFIEILLIFLMEEELVIHLQNMI